MHACTRISGMILLGLSCSVMADAQVPDSFFADPGYREVYTYPAHNLFGSDEIIDIALETDLKTLVWDVTDSSVYHDAVVRFNNESGQEVSIPARVQTRGHFRRSRDNCTFPPLKFRFKKKDIEGSLFEGHTELKLVAHCRTSNRAYEQFCIQEYLLYRIYNLITPLSYRVRLVRMHYIDNASDDDETVRYAFFVEDNERMSERNHARVEEATNVLQQLSNRHIVALFTVFQYMIGNTDWSLYYGHNVECIRPKEGGRIIPIPYDFDFSGALNTPYAIPDSKLPIVSVRQRIFRGDCIDQEILEVVKARFNGARESIWALYLDCEPLKNGPRKSTLDYYEKFYEILNDEKLAEKVFRADCKDLN